MPKTVSITSQVNGTLTTLGTDYTILSAKSDRQLLEIRNNDTTNSLYVYFGGAAYESAAYRGRILKAGEVLRYDVAVPKDEVHAASASNSVTYSVTEA